MLTALALALVALATDPVAAALAGAPPAPAPLATIAPAATSPAPAVAPAASPAPATPPADADAFVPGVTRPAPAPNVAPPIFQALPRLVGGSGATYEHADPAFLRAWVAANDPPRPPAIELRGTQVRYGYGYGSACAAGQCPRR